MEEEKVWLVLYHMKRVAQQWYYCLFRPPIWSNPLGELVDLRMTGTVEECQEKFTALVCHDNKSNRSQQSCQTSFASM